MRVAKGDEIWLWVGKPKPIIFKFKIYHQMTSEIDAWLQRTFKKGYGQDYYWLEGSIWFRQAKQETLFLLKWS